MTKSAHDEPLSLSVCLIVKDEVDDLARCLRSVAGLASDVVVIDTGSTDTTVDVARAHGARIARVPWTGDFAQARNTSLGMARGDWILILDADEELEDGSHEILRALIADPDAEAYWCRLISYLGDSPDDAQIVENIYPRLFRRRPAYRFEGRIHEQVLPSLKRAGIEPQSSQVRILHYGYLVPHVIRKGKVGRNVELLEQVLAADPTQHFQWFNLGSEYMRGNRPADAERAFRAALALTQDTQPRYLPVLARNLVIVLRMQGKFDEALRVLADFQARYPDYTDLWYIEGTIRTDLFDWAGVERAMQHCLELGDAPADYLSQRGAGTSLPWVWLGLAARETGRTQEALTRLRRAVAARPEDPVALQQLAAMLTMLQGPEAAGEALRPAAQRGRHTAFACARALAKAEAFAEALAVLPRAPRPEDEDPLTLVFAGECLFRLGRFAESLKTFLAVPPTDPLGLPARFDALLVALVLEDAEMAREIMSLLRASAPEAFASIVRTYGLLTSLATNGDVTDEIGEEDRGTALVLLRRTTKTFLSLGLESLASRAGVMMRLCGLTDGQVLCELGKIAYLAHKPELAISWLWGAFNNNGLDCEGLYLVTELSYLRKDMAGTLALGRVFLQTGCAASVSFYLKAASAALYERAYQDAWAFLEQGHRVYPHASVIGTALCTVEALLEAGPALPATPITPAVQPRAAAQP
ncbi:MAG: glycosyltransferase [bacterium]